MPRGTAFIDKWLSDPEGGGPGKQKYNSSWVLLAEDGELIPFPKAKKMRQEGHQLPVGEWFQSELEARYYRDVVLPGLQSGEIVRVDRQVTYVLLPKTEKIVRGERIVNQPITYTPDFLIEYRDGRVEAVETKGMPSRDFPLRQKLFDAKYPYITLVVMKYVKKFGGWITDREYKRAKRKESAANSETKPKKREKKS